MNFDNLKAMKPEELRELAGKQGLKVHHKAKPETIIKHIIENAFAPAQKPQMQHVAELPTAPVDHNTDEMVEIAIAHIKARQPAFVSKYNAEENTWYFECRGAEENGNLDIPLRVIVSKALQVSYGRRSLIGHADFDRGNATGKNAYTNTVLAG